MRLEGVQPLRPVVLHLDLTLAALGEPALAGADGGALWVQGPVLAVLQMSVGCRGMHTVCFLEDSRAGRCG